MSTINQVQLTNTFDEWRIATNSLVGTVNNLVNSNFTKLQGSFTVANGSVLITNGGLNVTGEAQFSNNIVAQGISFSIPSAIITVGNRINASNIIVSNTFTANVASANVALIQDISANNIVANSITVLNSPVLTAIRISDSVSSSSTANVASSLAVKTAYDKAIEALSSGSNQTAVYVEGTLLTPGANLNFKNTESITVIAQLNSGNVDLQFEANNIDFGISSGEVVYKGSTGLTGNVAFKYDDISRRLTVNNVVAVDTSTANTLTANVITIPNTMNLTSTSQSAINPAIRFGNINSGIYLKSANVISITANTSDMLTISNTAITATSEIRSAKDIIAFFASDLRLKENIKTIENALEKVLSLNGVSFDWRQSYLDQRGGEDGYFVRKSDIGLLAQEVERVIPEIVATRDDGYLGIKYELLIPLLIEAIKEQNLLIKKLEENQAQKNEELLHRLEALEL